MDLSWTEEENQLRRELIHFAERELNGGLRLLDANEKFNARGWKKCAARGILGLPIPREYGGSGVGVLAAVHALEGLGYGCKDNGLLFAMNAHIWACEIPILTFGTEMQKRKYLPGLCRGELIGSHAASEPDAGSDIFSLKTTAKKRGDRYTLNGVKAFVTNGPIADIAIVLATMNSPSERGLTGFVVEKGYPGFIVKRKKSKMGLRTALMGEIHLENCAVPAENRLGHEGAGIALFNHCMEWERGLILASAVGAMERLLERCVRYARTRKQFGRPIGKFQLVASRLVEMKLRLESSRGLLYRVAWLKASGRSAMMEAALAKLHISESWVQSCLDAVQIHGGYGYLTEYELERELRDAIGSKFFSGTSEIQRQVISQFMGL